MFIFTAKFSRRKSLLAIAAVLLLLLLPLRLLLRGGSDPAAPASGASNGERIAYLESLGWEVAAEPSETLSVTLPETLAEPYLSYNTLQLRQGFDLTVCCGQTLERYTYPILNHPARAESCQADLYLCNGVIVAGDVVCTGENGFMAPLAYPKA